MYNQTDYLQKKIIQKICYDNVVKLTSNKFRSFDKGLFKLIAAWKPVNLLFLLQQVDNASSFEQIFEPIGQ